MKEVKLPFKGARFGNYTGELALKFETGETAATLVHVYRPSYAVTTVIARGVDAATLREAARVFTEVADEFDSAKSKAEEEWESEGGDVLDSPQ